MTKFQPSNSQRDPKVANLKQKEAARRLSLTSSTSENLSEKDADLGQQYAALSLGASIKVPNSDGKSFMVYRQLPPFDTSYVIQISIVLFVISYSPTN